MIRRSILPRARPSLLLVMLSVTTLSMTAPLPGAIPAARAQDAGTQERLDRIERDLSMLQRQVYRGGGGGEAPAGAETGNAAINAQVRMDRLEQQMRDLTGRVENQTNQVEQLRQRLEQINSDIDVRLNQGQGQAQGQGQEAGSSAPPPPPSRRRGGVAMAPPEPSPGADPAPYGPYGRPRPPAAFSPPEQAASFGTLTPPDADQPYPGPTALTPRTASAGVGDTPRPPRADSLRSGSVSEQYNSAFGLLRRADYPAAEDALRGFVHQHPNDPLAGNAQYWLGESFYARGKYADASAAFADGYKRYPKGPKAADGLLKLGMSLARANQKHNACIALMELDHDFPHPGSAIKDRAAQEKKRLGC